MDSTRLLRIHQTSYIIHSLVLACAAFSRTAFAAAVQHRAGENSRGEYTEENQRGRRVDRILGRGAGDRKIEVDGFGIVHAHVKHDEEDAEKHDGLNDG